VVKDGARGAFAVTPDGAQQSAASYPCTPLDTIGAGDTFDAAFLDAWLAHESLETSLRRAVVASALSVTSIGGTAGQPTRAELDALIT
jgi:sugar/nucleoside kinase (ribokinase family)